MKPIDETWVAVEGGDLLCGDEHIGTFDGSAQITTNEARARLAAKATLAFRMLLEMWNQEAMRHELECMGYDVGALLREAGVLK